MQFESLEWGEEPVNYSDGTEDSHPGLRAGFYDGWENDIDLSVYEGEDLSVYEGEDLSV